ncbi:LptF/LptG family permease [Cruoricaptor ignavus]|uniref:LptF/LptG family permease n=1 Tax=Cruoricaptor ignavus TaxID=1118202 RepID=UPI00370DD426
MKILDRYIIKTFFGPFLFIFSVLFFIFIVNIIWTQMAALTGKGLTTWELVRLFYYLSASVVSMVLPLTILLASIMAFGDFGERYELAAMKAAGVSLARVMAPLFFVSIMLAGLLFYFQNNVTPDFQRKARNMLYNIAATKPALNFSPGQFIGQIPGSMIRFDKISGDNGENIDGIFLHKSAPSYEDQQTIIARNGKFVPAENPNFLKLLLFSGYIYEDQQKNLNFSQRTRQPNQAVKFDTLIYYFDVSALLDKALEKEQITNDYRFQTYREISGTVAEKNKENQQVFNSLNNNLASYTGIYTVPADSANKGKPAKAQFDLQKITGQQRLDALLSAYRKIENLKNEHKAQSQQIYDLTKSRNRIIIYQQRIIAYSLTCIIFFIIGSSLGSIIRKGGMGLPVVIAIIIFIIFYVMNLTIENLSWKGRMDPYLAAWLPNLVLFPFAVWLMRNALADSPLFDAEKYKAVFKPLVSKFRKKPEHERYQ